MQKLLPSDSRERQRKLLAPMAIALAAVFSLSAANRTFAVGPVGIDGTLGAEWTGIVPKTIPYDPSSVGVTYDVYSRADAHYIYALVNARPAGVGLDHWSETIAAQLGNVVNLGFDLNYPVGNGSDVVLETENNRYTDFPPTGSFYQPYSATNGIVQASTAVRDYGDPNPGFSVELAIPWTFFETDPDATGNMPVLTAANPDLVFRYSQSFDGTFATQGAQFGNPTPRFGLYTDPNFVAVPEPSSAVLFSLSALGLCWQVKRKRKSFRLI